MSDEISTVAALLSSHDAGGVWNLDPARSTFAFRNKTMWGLMTVKGHFGEVRGDARVTYTGAVSGRLAITAASLNTRNRKRDEHLRSADFFDVEKFSEISVVLSAANPSDGDTVNLLADINIEGISHPLPLHAIVAVLDDGAVRVLAQTIVDREQLGVSGNLPGMVGATTHLWPSAVANSSGPGDQERDAFDVPPSPHRSTRRISCS